MYLSIMKSIITICLCIFCLSASAQKEIKIDDAKSHVGEVVKICTKIYGGKYFEKDSLTLLNAGAPYPQSPLTVVIRGSARDQFNKPESYYNGAEVCLTGKIELYRDKPQIEIKLKSQVIEQLKDHIENKPK